MVASHIRASRACWYGRSSIFSFYNLSLTLRSTSTGTGDAFPNLNLSMTSSTNAARTSFIDQPSVSRAKTHPAYYTKGSRLMMASILESTCLRHSQSFLTVTSYHRIIDLIYLNQFDFPGLGVHEAEYAGV